MGADVEPIYEAPRAGDVRDSQADISKARRVLRYEPTASFKNGLERTIAWYRATETTTA